MIIAASKQHFDAVPHDRSRRHVAIGEAEQSEAVDHALGRQKQAAHGGGGIIPGAPQDGDLKQGLVPVSKHIGDLGTTTARN